MEADQLSMSFAPEPSYLELQDIGTGIKQVGHVRGQVIDFGVLPKKGEWRRVTTSPVWITTSDRFYTFDVVKWVDNS